MRQADNPFEGMFPVFSRLPAMTMRLGCTPRMLLDRCVRAGVATVEGSTYTFKNGEVVTRHEPVLN